MKKLKNWYVRFETIKGGASGLINMADYIYNNEHDNHKKDGHKVIAYEATRSEMILKNILHVQQQKDNETLLKRKGGRPSTFGKSLLISFPAEIKFSDEQYKSIRDALVDALIQFISDNNDLKYNQEQLTYIKDRFILSSLHKQENNDHFNIIVPNVFLDLNKNKSFKRIDLGKKMYSHFLKSMTNKLLLDYGTNYLDYQIKSQRNNRNRKNKLHHTIEKMSEKIEQLHSLFKEMEFLKDISSQYEKRIGIYINRMKTASEEMDKEKFEKNLDLANKSYNKLKGLISDTEDLKKLSSFEDLKKSIENERANFSISSNYPSPSRN